MRLSPFSGRFRIARLRRAPGETACFIARPKPENYVKMLLLVMTYFTSSFTIEEVPCTSIGIAPPA